MVISHETERGCLSQNLRYFSAKRNSFCDDLQICLTAVLPLPTGNRYNVYHILHNGSDTSHCRNITSACFSLIHVLSLYYAKPPTTGLAILTDKSLLIDQNTMVSVTIKQKRMEQANHPAFGYFRLIVSCFGTILQLCNCV